MSDHNQAERHLKNAHSRESGSVIAILIGGVMLVGLLSFTAYNLLSGPVRSAAIVTMKTKAQNDILMAAKILMRAADDPDTDDVNEPPEFNAAVTTLVGGGGIPATVGAAKIDPWRIPYGYCVWNHGPDNSVLGHRLAGNATSTVYNSKVVIAVVSAGPNRVFETSCAGDPVYLTLPADSDDLVQSYTFDEAQTLELWKKVGATTQIEYTANNVLIGPVGTPGAEKLQVAGDGRITGSLTAAEATFGSLITDGFINLNGSALSVMNNVIIGNDTPMPGNFTSLSTTGLLTSSSTRVDNLNADLLDGHDTGYFQDAANMNAGRLDPDRLPVISGDLTLTRAGIATATAAVTGLQGRAVDSTAPGSSNYLAWNGTTSKWEARPFNGDLAIAAGPLNRVVAIQGNTISTATPAVDNVLGWNGSMWAPMLIGNGAGGTVSNNVNFLARDMNITSASCAAGQVPKYNGSLWSCAADVSGTSQWVTNGSDVYYNTGNVGIGIAVPTSKLHVVGTFRTTGVNTLSNLAGIGTRPVVADASGVLSTSTGISAALPLNADLAPVSKRIVEINASADPFLGFFGPSNTYLGEQAGKGLDTIAGTLFIPGDSNTFVGYQSGYTNVEGTGNAFVGASAGNLNFDGNANTFMGASSGLNNSSGNNNSFFGNNAGFNSDAANNNTYVGANAGQENVNSSDNTMIGYNAGFNNAAAGNTFMGAHSGETNSTGTNNSFVGYNAGQSGSTAINNTFMGSGAGQSSTGSNNAFYGYISGNGNSSGFRNTFNGAYSGYQNTSGADNTFVGYQAGGNNSTASSNTYVGSFSGSNNTTGNNNTFVGVSSGVQNTANFNTFIGSNAGNVNSSGAGNTFVGYQAGNKNTTSANNTFIGSSAGRVNTGGQNGTYIGYNAGYSNTTGQDNIFLGSEAGYNNTTGGANIAIGVGSGYANVTGGSNVFIGELTGNSNTAGSNIFMGAYAGRENTSGSGNVFIGDGSGTTNTSSGNNTFLGTNSGLLNTGADNTFLGYRVGRQNSTGESNSFMGSNAGRLNSTGANNVFVGFSAGFNNAAASSNTFVGDSAGLAVTSGGTNTFLGSSAGSTTTTGTGNILIGQGITATASGTSNYLNIGTTAAPCAICGNMVTGPIALRGGFTLASDQRLKQDIHPLAKALDKVMALRGVTYHWKPGYIDDKRTHLGFIAQEVKKVIPEVVHNSIPYKGETYYSIAYTDLVPVLTEAIKEQQRQIQAQQDQIDDLAARLDRLERRGSEKESVSQYHATRILGVFTWLKSAVLSLFA